MAGLTCYNLKDFIKSLEYFSTAVSVAKKKNLQRPAMSSIYGNRALPLIELGKYDEAMNDCRSAIDTYPRNKIALKNMSKISYRLRDFEKSIQYSSKAIALCGGEKQVFPPFNFRGLSSTRNGYYHTAIEDLQKAIDIVDMESGVGSKKESSKTSTEMKTSTEISSTKKMKVEYFTHLGISHDRLGNYESAIRHFSNADKICSDLDSVSSRFGLLNFSRQTILLRRGISSFRRGDCDHALSDFSSVRKSVERSLTEKKPKFSVDSVSVLSKKYEIMSMLIDQVALSWIGLVQYDRRDVDLSYVTLSSVISELEGLNSNSEGLNFPLFMRNFYEVFKVRAMINFHSGNFEEAYNDFCRAEKLLELPVRSIISSEKLNDLLKGRDTTVISVGKKEEEEEEEEERESRMAREAYFDFLRRTLFDVEFDIPFVEYFHCFEMNMMRTKGVMLSLSISNTNVVGRILIGHRLEILYVLSFMISCCVELGNDMREKLSKVISLKDSVLKDFRASFSALAVCRQMIMKSGKFNFKPEHEEKEKEKKGKKKKKSKKRRRRNKDDPSKVLEEEKRSIVALMENVESTCVGFCYPMYLLRGFCMAKRCVRENRLDRLGIDCFALSLKGIEERKYKEEDYGDIEKILWSLVTRSLVEMWKADCFVWQGKAETEEVIESYSAAIDSLLCLAKRLAKRGESSSDIFYLNDFCCFMLGQVYFRRGLVLLNFTVPERVYGISKLKEKKERAVVEMKSGWYECAENDFCESSFWFSKYDEERERVNKKKFSDGDGKNERNEFCRWLNGLSRISVRVFSGVEEEKLRKNEKEKMKMQETMDGRRKEEKVEEGKKKKKKKKRKKKTKDKKEDEKEKEKEDKNLGSERKKKEISFLRNELKATFFPFISMYDVNDLFPFAHFMKNEKLKDNLIPSPVDKEKKKKKIEKNDDHGKGLGSIQLVKEMEKKLEFAEKSKETFEIYSRFYCCTAMFSAVLSTCEEENCIIDSFEKMKNLKTMLNGERERFEKSFKNLTYEESEKRSHVLRSEEYLKNRERFLEEEKKTSSETIDSCVLSQILSVERKKTFKDFMFLAKLFHLKGKVEFFSVGEGDRDENFRKGMNCFDTCIEIIFESILKKSRKTSEVKKKKVAEDGKSPKKIKEKRGNPEEEMDALNLLCEIYNDKASLLQFHDDDTRAVSEITKMITLLDDALRNCDVRFVEENPDGEKVKSHTLNEKKMKDEKDQKKGEEKEIAKKDEKKTKQMQPMEKEKKPEKDVKKKKDEKDFHQIPKKSTVELETRELLLKKWREECLVTRSRINFKGKKIDKARSDLENIICGCELTEKNQKKTMRKIPSPRARRNKRKTSEAVSVFEESIEEIKEKRMNLYCWAMFQRGIMNRLAGRIDDAINDFQVSLSTLLHENEKSKRRKTISEKKKTKRSLGMKSEKREQDEFLSLLKKEKVKMVKEKQLKKQLLVRTGLKAVGNGVEEKVEEEVPTKEIQKFRTLQKHYLSRRRLTMTNLIQLVTCHLSDSFFQKKMFRRSEFYYSQIIGYFENGNLVDRDVHDRIGEFYNKRGVCRIRNGVTYNVDIDSVIDQSMTDFSKSMVLLSNKNQQSMKDHWKIMKEITLCMHLLVNDDFESSGKKSNFLTNFPLFLQMDVGGETSDDKTKKKKKGEEEKEDWCSWEEEEVEFSVMKEKEQHSKEGKLFDEQTNPELRKKMTRNGMLKLQHLVETLQKGITKLRTQKLEVQKRLKKSEENMESLKTFCTSKNAECTRQKEVIRRMQEELNKSISMVVGQKKTILQGEEIIKQLTVAMEKNEKLFRMKIEEDKKKEKKKEKEKRSENDTETSRLKQLAIGKNLPNDKARLRELRKEMRREERIWKERFDSIGEKIDGKLSELEEESTNCIVCFSRERGVCFLPCGHVICCVECSRRVNKCPNCRKRIQSRAKIFT